MAGGSEVSDGGGERCSESEVGGSEGGGGGSGIVNGVGIGPACIRYLPRYCNLSVKSKSRQTLPRVRIS